ncbi:hypothetical protein HYH03_003780 [Edaphochlamys debaryana]|uniref:Uncharacterized protein n=1 Tax=Edaphochlamys debaryana TaxID=47281 RepID=A0A835YH09_9CHLO|nr:hypothetical protein HYH03_003780 [Edaphochlamys debaryana]|eukprot:KAG2498530.1 hypothetical protein HYH03_003780 [Edaphochlamys debaryana]
MGSLLRGLAACFSPGAGATQRRGHGHEQGIGSALAESTEEATEAQRRLQPDTSTSGRASQSPVPETLLNDTLPAGESLLSATQARPPILRWGSKERPQTPDLAARPSSILASGAPRNAPGSSSVRFAPGAAAPAPALKTGNSTRPSRSVRVQAPEDDSPDDGEGGGPSEGTSVHFGSSTSRLGSQRPESAVPESKALTQLVGRLIARDINYRAEFESIMDTFGPTFPRACLETFLANNAVQLPPNRQQILCTLYAAPGDPDKIDGITLLKDLDRAAFKRFAMASGGKGQSTEKKPGATTVQRSDKSRIMTLVSTQLGRDKSFSINAGGGELTDAGHIQDMIQEIDLNNILIPVGTRARYVPATDDPESFQVPVWSLRAMHKRKQERERFLIGNDPDFKKLGQAGREALRKRLARRSMFQQQEIIANAVVAAARAAVEPSMRRMENSIHSTAVSRAGSFSRAGSNGSFNRGSSGDLRSAGSVRPRSAAPPPRPSHLQSGPSRSALSGAGSPALGPGVTTGAGGALSVRPVLAPSPSSPMGRPSTVEGGPAAPLAGSPGAPMTPTGILRGASGSQVLPPTPQSAIERLAKLTFINAERDRAMPAKRAPSEGPGGVTFALDASPTAAAALPPVPAPALLAAAGGGRTGTDALGPPPAPLQPASSLSRDSSINEERSSVGSAAGQPRSRPSLAREEGSPRATSGGGSSVRGGASTSGGRSDGAGTAPGEQRGSEAGHVRSALPPRSPRLTEPQPLGPIVSAPPRPSGDNTVLDPQPSCAVSARHAMGSGDALDGHEDPEDTLPGQPQPSISAASASAMPRPSTSMGDRTTPPTTSHGGAPSLASSPA